ncbi:hypothetical protein B0T40_09730 [Chromobacterium haemolyticum]|uniref:hypothetical protein n=1 Tax=Chromobacterium haemolyticum TaxID=394935 RepID=UPI0009DA73FE|nr:hypothetical protein [Chromobacterium haemolyticum]OQS36665.1 hypothetical protein B0T40_09730 [Chromobacterium haemolyticum]
MHILLSEDEQGALASCSLEAFRLYVLGLRPVVDIRTGLVGRGFPVSRAQLAINIQFAPPRGSRRVPWKPSLKQLDALVDELAREGLAKRVSTVHEVKKLVLRLPMVLLRPQEEGGMSGNNEPDTNGRPNSKPPQGFGGDAGPDELDASSNHEADISEISVDIDIPRACARVSELAAVADELRVSGDVSGWVAAGVTPAVLRLAVLRCREHIHLPRRIPANYLARALETALEGRERPIRQTAKPSASAGQPARPGNRWVKVAPDCAFDGVPPVSGNLPPEAAGGGDDWIE